jgi:hypothetical protein
MVGQYVRLIIAPNTRMGTVTDTQMERGRAQYLFHHDERFDDTLPDSRVYEDEIESCERPADTEVDRINKLAKYSDPA